MDIRSILYVYIYIYQLFLHHLKGKCHPTLQRVGHFTIEPRTLQDEDQIVVCKPQTKKMLASKSFGVRIEDTLRITSNPAI